jgi:hypothetical protein
MAERLNPKLTKRNLAANMKADESIATASSIVNSEDLNSVPSLPVFPRPKSPSREQSSGKSSSMQGSETSSIPSSRRAATPLGANFVNHDNPKRHLLHCGKWIPKVFTVTGRLQNRTGIWTCCGHTVHYSLYCESIAVREKFMKALAEEQANEKDEFQRIHLRKLQLRNEVNAMVPIETPEIVPKKTNDEVIVDIASSLEVGFNAPMLVSWLLR